jgi:hypothetical protein
LRGIHTTRINIGSLCPIQVNQMADDTILILAAELTAKNKMHFPDKSPEYRQARSALLANRLSSGATLSALPHYAARFHSVERFPKAIS